MSNVCASSIMGKARRVYELTTFTQPGPGEYITKLGELYGDDPNYDIMRVAACWVDGHSVPWALFKASLARELKTDKARVIQQECIILKPCPHCGEIRNLILSSTSEGCTIRCKNCGAAGPFADLKDIASVGWNERKAL